ncbi:MAG TPA: DUF4157 domain-containing protein [Allosphingosinicella sp.]|nr:DUF4157 domain-containing protein [Allosphingosinicella sp.]
MLARARLGRATSAATAGPSRTPAAPISAAPKAIQRKLKIGPANDPLEREADRIADAVMRGEPAGSVSASPPAAQRACAACEAEAEGEEVVQRKCAKCAQEPGQAGAAEAAASAVATGGTPLSAEARRYFEPRFGRDFSAVRVHTDARAEGAARSLGARAYTLGADVAFAAGEYAPAAPEGRRLIAHELAHVVQQGGEARVVRRQAAGSLGIDFFGRPIADPG